ncbi:MAG TPA: DUF1552 domain-containing protein [Polyangia bacterium]|nr:DUF1552 domain-containing protein [Polyangia bacterium]
MASLGPRSARAQALPPPPRFVAVYFPCGAGNYWKPMRVGRGDGWLLSPVLAPLATVKDKVTVLSNVDNAGPFRGGAQPGHALLTGAFLTCTRPTGTEMSPRNAISVDQVLARAIGGGTAVPSLQLGLATTTSSTEGQPTAFSRSISWGSETEPLGRLVDPQAVFDRLVGAGPIPAGNPFARMRAVDQSVLDYVRADASAMQSRLSRKDAVRLDAFLTSVRELEQRLGPVPVPTACPTVPRPAQAYDVDNVPANYSRDRHADLMIDLMVMALECGRTRVISLMMDDAHSDYLYGFLPEKNFGTPSAPPRPVTVSVGLHDLATGGAASDAWATVTQWMVSKVARLARQMDAIPDSSGVSLLDNSLIWLGSETHGQDHSAQDLPLLYIGSAGKRLSVNQHVSFATSAKLSDVYFTLLRRGFGLSVPSFADGQRVIQALLT